MKTSLLCVAVFVSLLALQGCAVNVIVAPNATFVGHDLVQDESSDVGVLEVCDE